MFFAAAVLTARSDSPSLLRWRNICAAAKELLSISASQQFSLKAETLNPEKQRNGGAEAKTGFFLPLLLLSREFFCAAAMGAFQLVSTQHFSLKAT